MNHFLLPGEIGQTQTCTRYGIHAMELLINDIMKLGGDRRRLQAKVFGAARILNVKFSSRSVGANNARFVKEFLATEGIPVAAEYLGGGSGLKVRFLTHTGKAFVKPLEGTLVSDVAAEERRYKRELTTRVLRQVPEKNVTLFGDAP
jgi:chemotaxis protein CheD